MVSMAIQTLEVIGNIRIIYHIVPEKIKDELA